jgi:hypothetical protein
MGAAASTAPDRILFYAKLFCLNGSTERAIILAKISASLRKGRQLLIRADENATPGHSSSLNN